MKKKWLIIGGIAIVVIAIIVVQATKKTGGGVSVQAETATSKTIVETVSASGRVQPETAVDITSEINGEIIDLYVTEGQRVEAGDLLVVLDTVQLRSDAEQARYRVSELAARVDAAKSTRDQNLDEYERQKRLYEQGLTSETAYKNARYAYESAEASYKATKAQYSQFEAAYEKQLDNLSKATIVAPMSGVVTFLDCEVGEIAAAQTSFTQGRTLMTISNMDVFEVDVEVDETEITKVDIGQAVDIEVDAFPDTIFAGRVVEVGNTAIFASAASADQSTNFRVKVLFEQPNPKIRPGMSATVDITTNRRPKALAVPYSAIVMRSYDRDSLKKIDLEVEEETDGGSDLVQAAHAAENDESVADSVAPKKRGDDERIELKGVFVIRDGKAQFVQVETGIADQKDIEVVIGLEPGDSVIAGPYRILRTVKDGDLVEPRQQRQEDE